MRKTTVVLAVLLVMVMAVPSFATNGYQLIGVGQKQKSMGGAVTAAPMDAMTAISNPAGMARIGTRADFSMEAFMPSREVDFTGLGGQKEDGGSELYGIPALGWTAPAFNRNDMFFGGGMFATSGLGVDYGQTLMTPANPSMGMPLDVTFDGYSAIQFWKMAPTVAWNVNDRLSLGASLNVDYQSVTIRETIQNVPFWNDPTNPAAGVTQMDVNFDLGRPTNQLGFGASIGALYDVTSWLTVGATYTSKQYFAEGEYRVGDGDVSMFNGATGQAGTYKLDLDYPQQFAVGVAVKPHAMVTVTADVKWINWSDTHDKVELKGPANSFSPDGVTLTDKTKLDFGWDDQWVYALGVQVQPMDRLNVRMGYNYAKAPIDEEDVFNNLIFPAIVEHHFAIGFDYMLGAHWGVGMTYMKAFEESLKGKNDVPAGFDYATPFGASSGAKTQLEEDSVGVQLTYVF